MRVEVSEVTQLCGRATFPEILLSAASRVLPTDGSAFVRVCKVSGRRPPRNICSWARVPGKFFL